MFILQRYFRREFKCKRGLEEIMIDLLSRWTSYVKNVVIQAHRLANIKELQLCVILGIFVAATMGLSTMSVVTTVIVLYIHHEAATTPVPRWIRVVFFQYISTIVCFGVYKPSSSASRSTSVASKMNEVNADQHDDAMDNEMKVFDCRDQTGFNKISSQVNDGQMKHIDCRHLRKDIYSVCIHFMLTCSKGRTCIRYSQ